MILNEKTGMIEIKPDKKVDTKPDVGNGTSQDLQCGTSEKQVTNITKSINKVQSQETGNETVLKEEDSEWEINNTVLTRYYLKKSWKYYIGVIQQIDNDSEHYEISYYKTVH